MPGSNQYVVVIGTNKVIEKVKLVLVRAVVRVINE